MKEKKETALRYNQGKLAFQQISNKGLQAVADVYTRGAHKYSTYRDKDGNEILGKDIPFENAGKYELVYSAADNWRKGQSWTASLGSIKRHIQAFESGEDIDPELGTPHLGNAAWGLFTLLDYYTTYPEGDDRKHAYLNHKKIGLDIDEVLADWVGHWTTHHGQERPETWNFDRHIGEKFELLKDDKEFWLSIPVKTKPSDIPFEPHCYITSRIIPKQWTEEWLDINGFPAAPVYSIGHNESKVDVARDSGIDIFVDDRFSNFVELNKNGICCFLFDAPHNRRYDVGYKRIHNLKDLV